VGYGTTVCPMGTNHLYAFDNRVTKNRSMPRFAF
jgi:hypothetical protein